MLRFITKLSSVLCLTVLCSVSFATTLTVDIRKPGSDIAPTMYGIFFEDINYGADGGLYAELVKNRSFEFPDHLMGWTTSGPISVVETSPFDRCPHAVHMGPESSLCNEGYFHMGFHQGEDYRFTVWARTTRPGSASLSVCLFDNNGASLTDIAQASLLIGSEQWTRYTLILPSRLTTGNGFLRLTLQGDIDIEVDHVSLFPVHTFNGHENGLRADLAQALADLHPGVFRFPGGCVVEGNNLPTRYQWKNSVGPVENRPLNENRWLNAMPERLSPDYYQSLGLGFYEYFLLAEEIGAAPLPVLNAGMACEFVNDPTTEGPWLVPLDSLQPYIDDALDLIEFANGDPATNKWAALRAEMGHPASFGLKYLAIGNEQWGRWFAPRLALFAEQIRAKYPDIVLIGTAGPSPEGDEYDMMWSEMRSLGADLVDEHYYHSVEWFLSHATRYDNFSRKGPKVFAGEYACHVDGISHSHNQFSASLAEAALMTGLERNADVVRMATYAPLFAHVEGWQWRPDMIWFNGLTTVASCSYYVQQLFSTNVGQYVLPALSGARPLAGLEGQDSLFACASMDEEYIYLKVVNVSRQPASVDLRLKGLKGSHAATRTTFSSSEDDIDNTLLQPHHVVPVVEQEQIAPKAKISLLPRSLTVLRIRR